MYLKYQEFDTGVYRLDCNLLKSVVVPEPPPVTEDTGDTAPGSSEVGDAKMSDAAGDAKISDNAGDDKMTDETNEVHSDMLAGV